MISDRSIVGPDQIRSPASGLRLRVLLPLAVALISLLILFVAIFVTDTKHRRVENISHTAASVDTLFREQSVAGVETMRSIMELILQHRSIEDAFQARDRMELFQLSAPILQNIRLRNKITHFYYILPDTTMLLRVQAPEKHGDKIGRFVLQEAMRTGGPFWGNEQGPLGTFTLRVVYPWISRGQIIGYLEMGIEFEDIMANIKQNLGVDVFVAIDKSYFDAKKWEEAQRQRKTPVDWNEFPNVVVLSRTTSELPPQVRDHLSQLSGRHVRQAFEIAWDRKVAQTIIVPFSNLQHQELGEMIVLRDITASASERRRVIIGVPILVSIIGGILVLFFFVLLGRVEQDVGTRVVLLATSERVLAEEQFERQRAERELRIQQERNGFLEVRSQMVEQLASAKEAAETALRENEKVTSELRATQAELVATARRAGMAEIANNVLHNVGNVLNSVNISAGLIGRTLRESKSKGLIKAVQMLNEHATNLKDFLTQDEKGRMLPSYVGKAVKIFAVEQEQMINEANLLTKNIDHIKAIVATQQTYAGRADFLEPAEISRLLEDALHMHDDAISSQQIMVITNISSIPKLLLDKYRIMQILVNLIGNSIQALERVEDRPRQINISANLSSDGSLLRISIGDNGEGITAENLPRLFIHGFTTRKEGHGFGLHSSALAAQGMGGQLRAESSGPGKGAVFTLEIPTQSAGPL